MSAEEEKPAEDFIQDADMEVDEDRSEAIFRYTIRNFSKKAATQGRMWSPKCHVRHAPFRILVNIVNSTDFGFFLYCQLPKEDQSWSCEFLNIYYRILAVREDVGPLVHSLPLENDLSDYPQKAKRSRQNIETNFNYQTPFRGFQKFTTVDFLLNPENGYIKDDAVTLEVYIHVTEAVSVPRVEGETDRNPNEEPNNLLEAITLQNVEKCATLLKKEEHHNTKDINGRTPLMWAVYEGNLKIVQLLAEASTIDTADIFGYTPLMRAVEFGHKEVVKYLLQKGAGINFAVVYCLRCDSNYKFTTLHFAVNHLQYCKEMIRFLVGHGADLSSVQKETALELVRNGARSLVDSSTIIWLIETSQFDLAKKLLQLEKHIDDVDLNGCSPLMHAVRAINLEIVQMLVERGANPCKKDINGQSPFLQSILLPPSPYGTSLQILRYLIQHGAKFQIYTALHTAVKQQNIPVIKILLENKANPNLLSENGETPLTQAIKLNNCEIVKLLVEQGADVNLKDGKGCFPVFEAVNVKNLEIIKILLEKGSNVNVLDGEGSTPLLQSIKKGHLKILQLLVHSGADVNVTAENGVSPLMECLERQHPFFFKFLIDNGADLGFGEETKEKIVLSALETENLVFLSHLIDKGVDFSSCRNLLDTLAKENFDFAAYLKEVDKKKGLCT